MDSYMAQTLLQNCLKSQKTMVVLFTGGDQQDSFVLNTTRNYILFCPQSNGQHLLPETLPSWV